MSLDPPSPSSRWAWALSLVGLGLFAFALVAVSGPGRIDVVDGQTRFEVGRSLVEHGDSALRDERIWWGSFPGRDGLNFTYYRYPQSVAAAGAIVVADQTGPVREGRRHFFFVWTSAAAAALLSVFYAIYFRRIGCRTGFAILWALGGIVCTPNWFYGTSTFDDILGSLTVVAAAVIAMGTRGTRPILGAVISGFLLGVAFNVKQPLGAFLFVILAMHDNTAWTRRQRLISAVMICLGLLAGFVVQDAYDSMKFPFDKRAVHADLLKIYVPVYKSSPFPALACFLLSPGCGIAWYCPPALLGLTGVYVLWKRGERPLVAAVLLTTVVFIGFHCFVSFFKGDPSWGPRYLTPWFGFLWLFAPWAVTVMSRRLVGLLLGLGILVQVLGLAVDPHRLFVARSLGSSVGVIDPWLYFEPEFSHLLQRPIEIVAIARDSGNAEAYTPSPAPTFTFPVLDPPYLPESGREVVARYQLLRSFRPWWISQRFLPERERPVDIGSTLAVLGMIGISGLLLIGMTVRFQSKTP